LSPRVLKAKGVTAVSAIKAAEIPISLASGLTD
jgi:hypothetical protein